MGLAPRFTKWPVNHELLCLRTLLDIYNEKCYMVQVVIDHENVLKVAQSTI